MCFSYELQSLVKLCTSIGDFHTTNQLPIPSPFHLTSKPAPNHPVPSPIIVWVISSYTCFSPLAYTFPRGKWSQSGYLHRQKKLGSPRIILRAKYGIIGALMLGTGENCRLANGILETTCRLARWQCSRYSSTTAKYEVRSRI
jgi:hypothetical protein